MSARKYRRICCPQCSRATYLTLDGRLFRHYQLAGLLQGDGICDLSGRHVSEHPVCANCGQALVHRIGHWVHEDTRAQYCSGDTDSEGAQILVRKAEPQGSGRSPGCWPVEPPSTVNSGGT